MRPNPRALAQMPFCNATLRSLIAGMNSASLKSFSDNVTPHLKDDYKVDDVGEEMIRSKLEELGDEDAQGNMIESSLDVTTEVKKAMEGIIRYKPRAFQDLEHVNHTARLSWKVQENLQKVFSESAPADKIPLTNNDFLAWSRAKRGRNDALGSRLMDNALVNMCYLSWTTAVMLEELPDAVRTKCSELEERAERNRDSESDAAQERADGYDEIREDFEPYADECEACIEPAGNLRTALEAGNLSAAVDAIENGDLFLDIGAVLEE